MKLFIAALLVLGGQQASAFCAASVEMTSGKFVESKSAGHHYNDTTVAEKIKFVETELANRSVKFDLVRKSANKTTKTCVFANAKNDLEIKITSNGFAAKVIMSRLFEATIASDEVEDREIFKNEISIKGITASQDLGSLEVKNLFNYFSTCGFSDCTESSKVTSTLGILENVTLK